MPVIVTDYRHARQQTELELRQQLGGTLADQVDTVLDMFQVCSKDDDADADCQRSIERRGRQKDPLRGTIDAIQELAVELVQPIVVKAAG